MITNLINKIFPDNNEKFINKNSHLLIKINEEESKLINLSDEELSKYSRQLLLQNQEFFELFAIVHKSYYL